MKNSEVVAILNAENYSVDEFIEIVHDFESLGILQIVYAKSCEDSENLSYFIVQLDRILDKLLIWCGESLENINDWEKATRLIEYAQEYRKKIDKIIDFLAMLEDALPNIEFSEKVILNTLKL